MATLMSATDVVRRYTQALDARDFWAARHTVRDGKIVQIQAYFDARPFVRS